MSYLRTGVKGFSKIRRVLAKSPLILDEMCVLCKMRLIFPRINGPNVFFQKAWLIKREAVYTLVLFHIFIHFLDRIGWDHN